MARKNSGKRNSGRSSASRTGRASRSSKSASSRRTTSARTTTDHEEIRRWAEDGGGVPACVHGTGDANDVGMIRIEFPGAPHSNDANLQQISWNEFFEKFDERDLALLYQGRTAGGQRSNFYKIVNRNSGRRASSSRRSAA